MKTYFIRVFVSGEDQQTVLTFLDIEGVLRWIDENRETKFSLYQAECLLDWS